MFSVHSSVFRQCMVAALLAIVPAAMATVLVSEDFDYPDGALVTRTGGFGVDDQNKWTGPWQNSADLPAPSTEIAKWSIAGGQMIVGSGIGHGYPNLIIDRPFAADAEARVYYIGFDLKRYKGNPAGTLFGVSLDLPGETKSQPNLHIVGIATDNGRFTINANVVTGGITAGDFEPGEFHRIVGRLEFDKLGSSDVLSVWANPKSEDDKPLIVKFNEDIGGDSFEGMTLGIIAREISGTPSWAIDNLNLTTDFASARDATMQSTAKALATEKEERTVTHEPEIAAGPDRYWDWGTGFYYVGWAGRLTALDCARADWLLLRFPDLDPTRENMLKINQLIEMNPRLKIFIRVWPMQDFNPAKGEFSHNTPTGRASRMMYDFHYSPQAKEKILAETRRHIRVVLEHISKPENVVGMCLLEELPQFLTDMGCYMKDGETNPSIEAYREEIEAELGKPFVWNDEARRWWSKKYVEMFDEIHLAMKEAGEGRDIFYWPQTGYKTLDHVLPGTDLSTSSLMAIHFADIVKPDHCDGLFGYAGSASVFEHETLRFARERGWPFWSQTSHPAFMRGGGWEECRRASKIRMPQNLGTLLFCAGSCGRYPGHAAPANVDPTLPAAEQVPYRPPRSQHFGPYVVEHHRRYYAQENVGMDVVEKYLQPELSFNYNFDDQDGKKIHSVIVQVHNTRDASWFIDPKKALLDDVKLTLLPVNGLSFVGRIANPTIALGDIEEDGYRIAEWLVRLEPGTKISADNPLRVRLTVPDRPAVEAIADQSSAVIKGWKTHSIFASGDSWVEPTFAVDEPTEPLIRVRVLDNTAVNPGLSNGQDTIIYKGTVRASEELEIGPGRSARIMAGSLIKDDLDILKDRDGPDQARGWSDGEKLFTLPLMNPSERGAKLRITVSGKVADGARLKLLITGWILPASYLPWTSDPIVIEALNDTWQENVTLEYQLPEIADIRKIVAWREGGQGTIWIGNITVTPQGMPEGGIDVSDRLEGTLPVLGEKPLTRFTYFDDSEPLWHQSRVQVSLTLRDKKTP